jgi:hypothetical protein
MREMWFSIGLLTCFKNVLKIDAKALWSGSLFITSSLIVILPPFLNTDDALFQNNEESMYNCTESVKISVQVYKGDVKY